MEDHEQDLQRAVVRPGNRPERRSLPIDDGGFLIVAHWRHDLERNNAARRMAMRLGVVLPQTEIGGDPTAICDYAQAAESLGYDHLLAYDHVVGAKRGNP